VGVGKPPRFCLVLRLRLDFVRLDLDRLDLLDLDRLDLLDLDLEPPTLPPLFARTSLLCAAAAAAFALAKSGLLITGAGIAAPGTPCWMIGLTVIGAYGFGVGVGAGLVVVIALM
jgi:hypothetical protein